MANTFEYAELFQETLDELQLQESTTAWMEPNSTMVEYNGGDTIKIATISVEGYGNYNRETGYPAKGATLVWKDYTFDYDRGAEFTLDKMDEDETKFLASANAIIATFSREQDVPEIDSYRYSKIFSIANAAGKTKNYTPSVDDIYAELKSDITTIKELVGTKEGLVITMSFTTANILSQSKEIEKHLSVTDFSQGDIASEVKSIDGIPIVEVSSARFKSEYIFDDTGFEEAENAMNINWIILQRSTPIAISKTDEVRVFGQGVAQRVSGSLIQFRKYHTLFIKEQQLRAVLVSYESTPAPELSIVVSGGVAAGTTSFTATPEGTNTLAYSLTATAEDGFYNTIPAGTTAYTSGADIPATAGQYLNAYELDTSGRVQKFTSYQLQAGDIT